MKVMIVDDEILVRAGMKMIIPWNTFGFEITGEAANAEEAIVMACEQKPDLMLVDITMPGMDGLEMIRILQGRLAHCEYIILSCHSETAYLKSAIKLGVTDYISKDSLNPEEIILTLKKIINKKNQIITTSDIELERQRSNETIFLKARENKTLTVGEFVMELGTVFAGEYFAIAIEIEKYSESTTVIRICEEIMKEYVTFTVYFCEGNTILFLAGTGTSIPPQEIICHRCLETLAQSFDIRITLGASECCNGDMQLSQLLEMASQASDMRLLRGNGKFYLYDSKEQEKNKKLIFAHRKVLQQIHTIYQMNEIESYIEELDQVVRASKFIQYTLVNWALSELTYMINDLLGKEAAFTERPSAMDEVLAKSGKRMLPYEERYSNLISKLEYVREFLKKSSASGMMGQIERYISQNIENKILLEDIAKDVHLSRTYVSVLFKKEKNMNINDYITTQKLAYAKELLLKGENLWAVSEKIGIQSESYFVKLFKKQYGVTPAKFAKAYKL